MSVKERNSLAARIREVVNKMPTQSAAAEIAGVSLGQIKLYMKGQSAPSLLPISRLASAVGYDTHWIATGQGDKYRTPEAPPSGIDPRLALSREFALYVLALRDGIRRAYAEYGVGLPADREEEVVRRHAMANVVTPPEDAAEWVSRAARAIADEIVALRSNAERA